MTPWYTHIYTYTHARTMYVVHIHTYTNTYIHIFIYNMCNPFLKVLWLKVKTRTIPPVAYHIKLFTWNPF